MATDTTLAGLDALDLAPAPRSTDAGDRARRVWAALWPKLAAIALVWVIWELIHLTGWKKFVLPGPGVTLTNLWHQAKAGLLWHAVGDTVLRALVGIAARFARRAAHEKFPAGNRQHRIRDLASGNGVGIGLHVGDRFFGADGEDLFKDGGDSSHFLGF